MILIIAFVLIVFIVVIGSSTAMCRCHIQPIAHAYRTRHGQIDPIVLRQAEGTAKTLLLVTTLATVPANTR